MSTRIVERIKFRNISSTIRRTPTTSQGRGIYIRRSSPEVAPRPLRPRHPLLSGISLTASLTAVVISVATVAAWTYTSSSRTPQLGEEQDSVSADSDQTLWIQVYPGMSAQIPPGRPGNLTKEQELKLRELWEAIMGICGTWPNAAPSITESDRASQTEPESAKKKRGLGRLLGRGKKSEEDSADAEDKHGLNKEFREALASQSPEEIRNTMWAFTKADDPDAMLLRFLRARKWNVHDALVMAVATIHWRGKIVHLDENIMKQGEGGALEVATTGTGADKKNNEDFLAQLRMGKSYLHGEDKEGRPICLVRTKLHKQGEQTEASLERYTVYTIETARLMLRPPVDTAVSHANVSSLLRLRLNSDTDDILRHDRFLHGKHGLLTRQVHDQSVRGQLPRVTRGSPRTSGALGIPRYLVCDQGMARPSCCFEGTLHKERARSKSIHRCQAHT